MSDPTGQANKIAPYNETYTAPFVHFDGVTCHGAAHGLIEIELAARIMIPNPDGGVDTKVIPTARLRCSIPAAAALRHSLELSLKMAEEPQQQSPVAASKLN